MSLMFGWLWVVIPLVSVPSAEEPGRGAKREPEVSVQWWGGKPSEHMTDDQALCRGADNYRAEMQAAFSKAIAGQVVPDPGRPVSFRVVLVDEAARKRATVALPSLPNDLAKAMPTHAILIAAMRATELGSLPLHRASCAAVVTFSWSK